VNGASFGTPITRPTDSATVWRRFMGMVYETLLLFGPLLVVGFVYSFITGFNDRAPVETLAIKRLGLQVVLAIALLVYFVWSWSNDRVTLPMQTLGRRLVSATNGEPLSPKTALIRALIAGPASVTGVALLWALFDRDNQSVHDRIAGTRLIHVPVKKIL